MSFDLICNKVTFINVSLKQETQILWVIFYKIKFLQVNTEGKKPLVIIIFHDW
jgi:hypothetical protein